MDDDEMSALAELAEAEYTLQYTEGVSTSLRSELGVASMRIGGGIVLSVRRGQTNFWNQALGLGFEEPVSEELIDRVCGFYREHRPELANVQIAPGRLPPDWDGIRARQGLSAGPVIVQLASEIDEFQLAETDVRADPVDAADADEWASVLTRGFGWPEGGPLAAMMATAVTNPGFRAYAVREDDRIVAVAALFVHNEVAVFSGATTLPGHRSRGAQSALLSARARAAAAAGCRWLTAQTGKPEPGTANHSLNNMVRGGLKPLYDRPSWIWRRDGTR